jgi:perosamine synthetase
LLNTTLFSAPQPRSRLYTTAAAYGSGFFSAVTGYGYESGGTEKLERALEAIHPGSHAVAAPMARVGIYLTLKNIIRRGQKVILSPYTISDVVNMVLCAGGVPLFADIEPGGSCNIDAGEVRRLLESENDVGAVLVTHFYGLFCNIDPILEFCRARGIPVIEDAAQAFGARHDGQRAGTLGDAGIFSFGLLKNVTSFIGGAVLARDRGLSERIRQDLGNLPVFPKGALIGKMAKGAAFDLATSPGAFDFGVYWLFRYASLHGANFFKNKLDTDSHPVAYERFPASYAYRMSGIQADLICSQLDRVDRHAQERIAKAEIYDAGLRELSGLVLPPLRTDGSHSYFYYPIQCEDREGLTRYMTEKLRDVQISHHRNCAAMACFVEYQRDCPNAALAERRLIYLPTYPGYREDQVRANIEVIRDFLRDSTS